MPRRPRPVHPPTLDAPLLVHGLVCERHPTWAGRCDDPVRMIALSNVALELDPYAVGRLDWRGPGPASWTLGLNVLDRLYPPALWDVYDVAGRRTHCSLVAAAYHQLLAADLITTIPYWGGGIVLAALRAWVARVEAVPADQYIDLGGDLP